jgi:hypothetical protein
LPDEEQANDKPISASKKLHLTQFFSIVLLSQIFVADNAPRGAKKAKIPAHGN